MDIKIQGITREIMQVALAQAKEGRVHILGKMKESIEGSRTELSEFAPRMLSVKINPEKIRDVIGKGGATIRALTEETGTQIDIGDDGRSEEHTSELQSLMRISYAVFCLKKKNKTPQPPQTKHTRPAI